LAAAAAVRQARELAWAGQHAEAIHVASAALEGGAAKAGERIDLLDLRSESRLAQGDLAAARSDAAALLDLAAKSADPARLAQAGNRAAIVQIQGGESKAAIATAEAALAAARGARDRVLEATSLLRLAEACFRVSECERANAAAREAAALFRAQARPAGENRALWAQAAALSRSGKADEAQRVSRAALAIARSCGDWLGVGNAANMLTFDERDVGVRLRLLKESLAAFTRAGYVERQGVITHNLGVAYHELGLYRRARRHFLAARETYQGAGAIGGIARTAWMLARVEAETGHVEAMRRYMDAALAEIDAVGGQGYPAARPLGLGWLAAAEGDAGVAERRLRAAAPEAQQAGSDAVAMQALTLLSRVLLDHGDARGALAASTQAASLHAAHRHVTLQGMDPAELWWRHSQALAASRRPAEARSALDRAYRFLVAGIATLGDEGLRRNALDKVARNREIVAAWLAGSAGRRAKGVPPHLAGEASLVEPVERLADTGLRLNEIRARAELEEFLVDEATELSGAERVLLVLQTPQGRKLAGAQMPKGEDAGRLADELAPMLEAAQRSRIASLDHVPAQASPLAQRSRIVAPLVARHALVGYLYADIDGAFGRFHDADRDLLGMLASQAAVALDNVQWSESLEAKIAERTAELQAANTRAEQRANELAIINSVQRGLAGELTSQGVFEVVGEKLREMFPHDSLGIRTLDKASNLLHFPYQMMAGERVHPPPQPPVGMGKHVLETGRTLLVNEDVPGAIRRYGGVAIMPRPDVRWPKSQLTVPLKVGEQMLGLLTLANRQREHAITPADVRLLETLAASMSVALNNARLFDETQRLLKETEQRAAELAIINGVQAALADKLDLVAIYDLVGDRIRDVFDAQAVMIASFDHQRDVEIFNYSFEKGQRFHPPPRKLNATRRALIERRRSILDNRITADVMARVGATVVAGTQMPKSVLFSPMVVGQEVMGYLSIQNVDRHDAFTDADVRLLETLATSMGVALENARLYDATRAALAEVEARTLELRESLEYQTAISDVLQCISESPTDVGPVFRAILECATRLFGSPLAAAYRYDGELMHLAATHNWSPEVLEATRRYYPGPPSSRQVGGRVVLAGAVQEIEDALADPGYDSVAARAGKWRRLIGAPLLKDGRPLGALVVAWPDPGATPQKQIDLLRTFADQAVIAIENVRLFNETKQALERQTATAEVLRVIGASMSDAQPVFDAIVTAGARLFGSNAVLVDYNGELMHMRASMNADPAYDANIRRRFPRPATRDTATGRAILARATAVITDTEAEPGYAMHGGDAVGFRSVLAVPLLRDGSPIGAIAVGRPEPGPFTAEQTALLQTFADQAVIAIENARMFGETKEALAHQTASADILRVISSSPADVQPVFDAIVTTAVKHLGCDIAIVQICSGDTYSPKAMATPAGLTPVPGSTVMPVDPEANFPSRAIVSKTMLHVRDWSAVELPAHEQARHEQLGLNSTLYLPLLRGDACVGVLVLGSKRANGFNEKAIALAESFRDQAVIAIENVRLFSETREALERQTATARILSAMSGSLTDVRPVFDAIVESCRSLFADSVVALRLLRDGVLHVEANIGMDTGPVPLDSTSAVGTCVLEARTIHIDDLEKAVGLFPRTRQMSLKMGYRSAIFAPLLRGGTALGTIAVFRRKTGAFGEKDVTLLNTFADQAVIAIENVRLFNETREALEQQQASSEILSVISSSVADTKPVFEKILESGRHLFGSDEMDVLLVDEQGQLQIEAYVGDAHEAVAATFPAPLDRTPAGRAIRERRVMHWPDLANGAEVPGFRRKRSKVAG